MSNIQAVPTKSPEDPVEKAPFPPWLRELCYIASLILVLAGFGFNLKSDNRSQSEKLDSFIESSTKSQEEVSKRLSAIEGRLPNKEAEELRYKMLEQTVEKNRAELAFSIAKLENWKEITTRDLIKKGVID